MTEHEYSQGICQDGAAVLKNGQPMTIEQILEELRAGQSARAQGEPEPMIPTGRYTVEPHGKGYAIYRARDMDHHGENLGHLSDCLPYLPNMVEKVLNGQARPEYTVDREFLVQLLADRQKRIDSLEKDLATRAQQSGEGREPVITNEMKAECMGEFEFTIEAECGECIDVGEDEDCEVCQGGIVYERKVTVPWTTCKEIYKRMTKCAPKAQGVPEGWKAAAAGAMDFALELDNVRRHPQVAAEHIKGLARLICTTTAPADKPEGEWVRHEDQLPELTGWYCVALADPDDIGWSTSVSWVAFWNGDDFEECDPIEDGQPVTHWMPLPQPPVQGGGESEH